MTTGEELLYRAGIFISRALLPVEFVLSVCHVWSWLGSALVWSEASY